MLWRGLAMRLPFRFLFRALLLELLLCVSAVGDEWPSPQVRCSARREAILCE